jgi:ankyrin repeat protein
MSPDGFFSRFQDTTLNQFQSLILSSRNDQQLATLLHNKLNLQPSFIEGALRRAIACHKVDLLKHALEVNRLFPHDSLMKVNDELLLQQIHRTVTKQELELLECLISYLTNPRGPTNKEELQNIAIFATHQGFIEAVQLLCSTFPSCLEQTCQGHSLLLALASYEDDKCLQLLSYMLDQGVNANTQEPNGDTALHVAVRETNNKAVLLLLKHNACVYLPNAYGQSPLKLAHSRSLKRILKAQSSSHPHEVSLYLAAKSGQSSSINQLLDNGVHVDSKWVNGRTALCAAAMTGDIDTIDLLLSRGAATFPAGCSWPELPVAHALKNNHIDIAYLLMERTEQLHSQKTEKERYHIHQQLVYLLHYCCKTNATTVATLILDSKYNLDLDQSFLNGVSPIHVACKYGRLEILKILLIYGFDVNIRSEYYLNTPLHYACFYGHTHIAQHLIKHPDVNIDCENHQHETPLYCVLHGQLSSQEKGLTRESSVIFLLSHGAKLLKPGRKNCELANFDLNYALQRWDFIPFQTQKLIIVLRNEVKPYSLANMARFTVRGSLNVPVNEDVLENMGLPYRMQNYVMLKDWFPTN